MMKWVLLLWCAFLIGCQPAVDAETVSPTAEPTQIVVTATPSHTPTPTRLPSLTPSLPPPPTITLPPTETPVPTDTPSPTPTPTQTPTPRPTSSVDRTCPEFSFPQYNRYYLAAERWPTPIPNPQAHFWFGKPLVPGTGRLLTQPIYPYGYDGGSRYGLLLHNGVDVAENLGEPVLAIESGTVVTAREDLEERFGWRCDWYGHLVVIEHDELYRGEPVYSLYGHVLNIRVDEGQRVRRGEQVAEVGFGGAAKAWHLHLEIRVGDNDFFKTRNPMLWLAPGQGRGVIAGRLVDPLGRPWQGIPVLALPENDEHKQGTTWSYLGDPDDIPQPDDEYAENFVIADLKAGEYTVYTEVQGVIYQVPVAVNAGQITTVEIVTEPFKTQTPTPPADE